MTDLRKPKRLKPGDAVAVLSPSWGGAGLYPTVFDLGLANIRELFGVQIKEYPTTRMDADELYRRPQQRADDLNAAFADPQVSAIFSAIGGDDSVRLLPYLDGDAIRANPKILMGFSDTTTLLTFGCLLGLVTFNGPSVLAGFAQAKQWPDSWRNHVREILAEPSAEYDYAPFTVRAEKLQPWTTPGYTGEPQYAPNVGWRWLQGETTVQGRLFGGCIEVLEFLKSTRWWPAPEFWQGKILFLETSEEKPTPDQVKRLLRNYGVQGVFDQIAGLLFARPQFYTEEERPALHEAIISVVVGEFGRPDLPIVAEMDFGHEAPQSIMPLGILAEIDCTRRSFRLRESAVV